MKRITTILFILLPALLVSCQKAETKDEEQKRLLIGTWVNEGYSTNIGRYSQTRQIVKANGTVQVVLYCQWTDSLTGEGEAIEEANRSLVPHRHLQTLEKDATMTLEKTYSETWTLENGTLFRTRPEGSKFIWGKITELTATRLVLTSKGFGTMTLIKLPRWNSMTDAEIKEYYEEDEVYEKVYLDKKKREREKKKLEDSE
jgi:hypothetical protein